MHAENWSKAIQEKLGESCDIEVKKIDAGKNCIYLIFSQAATDSEQIMRGAIVPLVTLCAKEEALTSESIYNSLNIVNKITQVRILDGAARSIVSGEVVLLSECLKCPIKFDVKEYCKRAIDEPPTSGVTKGPREGFTEDLQSNISLLRRRIKSPELHIKKLVVGRYSNTDVAVVYINGIADKKLIAKITKRIKEINIDGIMDSSYVARFLEEHNTTLFRQVGTTEKPDVLAAKILEGRVGIIVDGSPIILTLPFMIIEDLQSSDDYFKRDFLVAMSRLIRILSVILAVLLPAIYVSLQEYEYRLLPLKFLVTVLKATSGIPLTPTIEMMVVLLLFEMLNETSLRMPKYVGMVISVVGAIILGDTAVKAGLLSSPAVLVTAISAISMYNVPDDAGTCSLLRFIFVGIAGIWGVYGIVLGIMAVIIHTASMNSYGAPYLAPYAPLVSADIKDGILPSDIMEMTERPRSFPQKNITRMRKKK